MLGAMFSLELLSQSSGLGLADACSAIAKCLAPAGLGLVALSAVYFIALGRLEKRRGSPEPGCRAFARSFSALGSLGVAGAVFLVAA